MIFGGGAGFFWTALISLSKFDATDGVERKQNIKSIDCYEQGES